MERKKQWDVMLDHMQDLGDQRSLREPEKEDDMGVKTDKLILQCMHKGKGDQIATVILEKNKVGKLTLAGLQT